MREAQRERRPHSPHVPNQQQDSYRTALYRTISPTQNAALVELDPIWMYRLTFLAQTPSTDRYDLGLVGLGGNSDSSSTTLGGAERGVQKSRNVLFSSRRRNRIVEWVLRRRTLESPRCWLRGVFLSLGAVSLRYKCRQAPLKGPAVSRWYSTADQIVLQRFRVGRYILVVL